MQKIPRSFFAIIPLKIVTSIVSTLVVIMVIMVGGDAAEVGLVMSLTLLGNLLGNIWWAKVLATTRKYVTGYIGGYFGLFFALIILLNGDILSIFISAFLITFMSNLTYLAAMFLVSESYGERLNEMMGLFEMIGGWAWVVGLAFGAIIIDMISSVILIAYLAIISFTAVILTSILLGTDIIKRIIEGIKKDFGLLPLLDMGLERLIEYEEVIPDVILRGVHVIFSGNIMYFPVYIKAKLPSRERALFYIAIFTQFIAFGLVYSQLIKFIKDLGYANSIIYIVSLISSVVAALMYPMAGKVKNIVRALVIMNIIRVVLFIMLISTLYLPGYLVTIVILIFSILDGYSWAYITILLNLIALKSSKEEVGISNFIRNIGNLLGAILSGLIITLFSYHLNFVSAIIILSLSISLYAKIKI